MSAHERFRAGFAARWSHEFADDSDALQGRCCLAVYPTEQPVSLACCCFTVHSGADPRPGQRQKSCWK